MRRYIFLREEQIYESLNKVRDAFLAAKDGNEVDKVIDGILTYDEKMKIGRRIIIANYLLSKFTIEEISQQLKVGRNTIMHVSRRLEKYRECFALIEKRGKTVEEKYEEKKFRHVGGSKQIKKLKVYSGFKRKDIERK